EGPHCQSDFMAAVLPSCQETGHSASPQFGSLPFMGSRPSLQTKLDQATNRLWYGGNGSLRCTPVLYRRGQLRSHANTDGRVSPSSGTTALFCYLFILFPHL